MNDEARLLRRHNMTMSKGGIDVKGDCFGVRRRIEDEYLDVAKGASVTGEKSGIYAIIDWR